MNLNTKEWKEFKIGKLFKIENGKKYPSDIRESGDLPLVSTSAENNGISDYIALRTDHVYSNFLTVAYSGSVGATFYHGQNVFVGETVFALLPLFKMTMQTGIFIATIMNFENYRYSYGRKIVGSKYGNTTIKLPICKDEDGHPIIDKTHKYSEEGYVPDWQFMEDYIKSLHYKPITTKNKKGNAPALNVKNWKEFKVSDIFYKKKVTHYSMIPDEKGDKPFISSTASNNGIAEYVNAPTIEGNCITISTNGDCFDCFYHAEPIVISADVEALYCEELNQFNALFIASVLRKEKIKWGYGRKPKNDKVYNTIIKLPSTTDGKPDWQFMEDYIKALPYGDRI